MLRMTQVPDTMPIGDENSFRLSRIQAEGWNAAHRLPTIARDEVDAAKVDALNPYATASERNRWMAGFVDALER